MAIADYRGLDVWKRAMELASECHKLTQRFPKSEVYGLSSQMRRAAVSVPSNIAEGQRRQHTAEYLQFVCFAHGSLAELETQTLLAREFGYLSAEESERMLSVATAVGMMLSKLRSSLERRLE